MLKTIKLNTIKWNTCADRLEIKNLYTQYVNRALRDRVVIPTRLRTSIQELCIRMENKQLIISFKIKLRFLHKENLFR